MENTNINVNVNEVKEFEYGNKEYSIRWTDVLSENTTTGLYEWFAEYASHTIDKHRTECILYLVHTIMSIVEAKKMMNEKGTFVMYMYDHHSKIINTILESSVAPMEKNLHTSIDGDLDIYRIEITSNDDCKLYLLDHEEVEEKPKKKVKIANVTFEYNAVVDVKVVVPVNEYGDFDGDITEYIDCDDIIDKLKDNIADNVDRCSLDPDVDLEEREYTKEEFESFDYEEFENEDDINELFEEDDDE